MHLWTDTLIIHDGCTHSSEIILCVAKTYRIYAHSIIIDLHLLDQVVQQGSVGENVACCHAHVTQSLRDHHPLTQVIVDHLHIS
jgi:hypothetical protein